MELTEQPSAVTAERVAGRRRRRGCLVSVVLLPLAALAWLAWLSAGRAIITTPSARGRVAFHCFVARTGGSWTPLRTKSAATGRRMVHPDEATACYRTRGYGPARSVFVEWLDDAESLGHLRRWTDGRWTIDWFPASDLRRRTGVLRYDELFVPESGGAPGPTPDPAFLRSLGFTRALAIDDRPRRR